MQDANCFQILEIIVYFCNFKSTLALFLIIPMTIRNFEEIKLKEVNNVETGRSNPVQNYLAEINNERKMLIHKNIQDVSFKI